MKKILTILMLGATLCSCDASEMDNGRTDSGSTSVQKTLVLTPFGQLNQGPAEINSHADEWQKSKMTMNYRSMVDVGSGVTGTPEPQYARMIKLADGSYMLFCQNKADVNGNGDDVYWATSPDMKNWTGRGVLFKSKPVTNGLGNQDTRWYTNGFGKVLKNGDLLVFASYRSVKTYGRYDCRYDHGIEMMRSTDNGKTWSEPYEIHHGPNWEAMILEHPSGELHCYFSESRPWISGSHSGTSMVKSTDGGLTWTPSVSNTDPHRVVRHTWWSEVQGKWLFTDQMPSMIVLNGTTQIAGAFESVYEYVASGKHFKIAFAYSPEDGEWDFIEGNEGDGSNFDVQNAEVGPADRILDQWRGVGPDLKQFPSGETLVSYTEVEPYLFIRMGDSKARTFGEPFKSLPGKGSWGAMMTEGSHEIVACMRNSTDVNNVTVSMVKWALNHRIGASSHAVTADGDNRDWSNKDEALFVGAKCQAQATLRCAADVDNVYFLVECLDENVSKDDYIQIFVAPSDQTTLNSKSIRLKIGPNGLKNQGNYAGGWMEKDLGATVAVSYDATLSASGDADNGWLAEVAVPRSVLAGSGDRMLVNLSLFDLEGGEDAISPTGGKNPQDWITVSGL